jgi:hypothetical protein
MSSEDMLLAVQRSALNIRRRTPLFGKTAKHVGRQMAFKSEARLCLRPASLSNTQHDIDQQCLLASVSVRLGCVLTTPPSSPLNKSSSASLALH